MMERTIKVWLLAVDLAFFPAIAYADAGTPLMWAGGLHLLFGNAIIGVAEGLILVLLFKLPARRCIAVMILANYFSAWVGGVFLISKISGARSLDLYNAWRWLWCMVVVTYVITLFLEGPSSPSVFSRAPAGSARVSGARWSCSRPATWSFSACIGPQAERRSIPI